MHLFDNVHLIGREVLALPTASTFERSIIKLASFNRAILGTSSVIVHGRMIGSHGWKKTMENSQFLLQDSLRSQGQESEPVSVEHYSVKSNQTRAAGYPILEFLDQTVNTTIVFIGRMHLLDDT